MTNLNTTNTDDKQQLAHEQSCKKTQQSCASQRPQIAKQTDEWREKSISDSILLLLSNAELGRRDEHEMDSKWKKLFLATKEFNSLNSLIDNFSCSVFLFPSSRFHPRRVCGTHFMKNLFYFK